MVLFEENMVSKESNIVCSVKIFKLEFLFLPIVDQLQINLGGSIKF